MKDRVPPLWSDGVVVIGCRHNTKEFVERLEYDGVPVAGIITLCEEAARRALVPTWTNLQSALGDRIPVHVARSYKLMTDDDVAALAPTRAAVGLCIGWQRLLPGWFLETVRGGVFGMHACQYPLPRGRGRSPINWSMINGAESLHAHVFRYGEEADTGSILDVMRIPVDPADDIHTLQQKCRVAFNRIVCRHQEALLAGEPVLKPQSDEPAMEYPKRTPDDGRIDWAWPVRRVVNWVRAQTRPYPGAFCTFGGERFAVWRCIPFGLPVETPTPVGTVVERFEDGNLVIAAGDGCVLLTDHTLPRGIALGEMLPCP